MSRQSVRSDAIGQPVRYRLRACRRNPIRRRSPRPVSTPLPIPTHDTLVDGIFIPEYGVLVPWGIQRDALFRLIPRSAFRRTGHWPTLRFTLFGVTCVHGFNFCRGDGLHAVQFDCRAPRRRTYRRYANQLIAALGRPNFVDYSTGGQQTWLFGRTVVEQVAFSRGRRGPALDIAVQWHWLHVYRRGDV